MSTIVYLVSIIAAWFVLTPLAIVITKKKINYNLQSRRVSLRSIFIDANTFHEAKNVAEIIHPGCATSCFTTTGLSLLNKR